VRGGKGKKGRKKREKGMKRVSGKEVGEEIENMINMAGDVKK